MPRKTKNRNRKFNKKSKRRFNKKTKKRRMKRGGAPGDPHDTIRCQYFGICPGSRLSFLPRKLKSAMVTRAKRPRFRRHQTRSREMSSTRPQSLVSTTSLYNDYDKDTTIPDTSIVEYSPVYTDNPSEKPWNRPPWEMERYLQNTQAAADVGDQSPWDAERELSTRQSYTRQFL